MRREVPRWNCPTRQEFRTVESISSDFNITKHQSTYRIMTSTLPYIDEVMRSFYNSGTGIPPRSPLEWFKRRCTGHVTARRCCASGCSLQFRQQIDGARGADADRCVVCHEPAFLSAPSPAYLPQLSSLRLLLDDAVPPLSHPCRAQHAVRSGCCADLLSVCDPLWLAVWFWLFAGQGAEEEGASEVVAGFISRRSRSRLRRSRC